VRRGRHDTFVFFLEKKRTIKSAVTVLSFLQVADPDGDEGNASQLVYHFFLREKYYQTVLHWQTGKNQTRFAITTTILQPL